LGRESRFQRDVERVRKVAVAGPKIVGTLVGLGLALTFVRLLTGQGDAYSIAGWVCLLVATGGTAVAWWLFPLRNLRYLAKWFKRRPQNKSNSQLELWASVVIAITLALLFITAWWPLFFNIVYLFYCLCYFLGVRHLNNNIKGGLQYERECLESEQADALPQRAQINEIYRNAYDAIDRYHISLPHEKRVVIMGVVGLATLPLVILNEINVLAMGGFAASIMLAITLVIAEVAITIWRGNYYNRMEELEEQLERLEVSNDEQVV